MSHKTGCDIEFFITSGESLHAKSIVPASAICEYGKDFPAEYTHGRMHWDNVLMEICPNAAEDEGMFVSNIEHMKENMMADIRAGHCQLAGYASAYLSHDLMKHETASKFDCNPDINAYTRQIHRTRAKTAGNLRTAGGHVHIGVGKLSGSEQVLLTKLCDMYLGIPSVLLDQDSDRRKLYGQAGSYRPKEYGIEYRVLSNFWAFVPNHMRWVYNQVEEIVELFTQMKDMEQEIANFFTPAIDGQIQNIINGTDRRRARAHIKSSNIAMP